MLMSQAIADALMRNEVPRIGEPELRQLREASTPDAANSNGESAPPASVETVTVDSAGYKAVSSVLLLLTMVTHLLQCVARLQSAASLAAHMLPELLRLFNSKAFRQVLHAGAMRPESAGLKAITAKHLALSSQSLGLVLALLPHLRAVLAAYVPEGQRRLLTELDGVRAKQQQPPQQLQQQPFQATPHHQQRPPAEHAIRAQVSADYEEHQGQLFSKLVSILEERRRENTRNLAEALAPPDTPRQPSRSSQIESVVKNVKLMHKTLLPLLTKAQLHTVFGQIMETFDAGLLEAYRAVDASAPYSRQCIVQDVHYLRTELAKLHLSLPSGYCPKLVAYAQGLPLS